MSAEDIKAADARHAHWIIEGVPYADSGHVYRSAVLRGYTGSSSLLSVRLQAGDCTWARLTRPVDKAKSAGAKRVHQRKHDEMAQVIAALDARKREMGL